MSQQSCEVGADFILILHEETETEGGEVTCLGFEADFELTSSWF